MSQFARTGSASATRSVTTNLSTPSGRGAGLVVSHCRLSFISDQTQPWPRRLTYGRPRAKRPARRSCAGRFPRVTRRAIRRWGGNGPKGGSQVGPGGAHGVSSQPCPGTRPQEDVQRSKSLCGMSNSDSEGFRDMWGTCRRVRTTASWSTHIQFDGWCARLGGSSTVLVGVGALGVPAATAQTTNTLGPPSTTPAGRLLHHCVQRPRGDHGSAHGEHLCSGSGLSACREAPRASMRCEAKWRSRPASSTWHCPWVSVPSVARSPFLTSTQRNATPTVVNEAASPIDFGPVALVPGHPATITVPSTPASVGPWTAAEHRNYQPVPR